MDKPDTASNTQLPKDIQELFEDSALSDAVFEIADKHEITGGKELNILLATEGVLTGLIAPVDFVKILSDALGVPWEKAALIAQDVNRSVFNYVKDSLKEIHKVAPTAVAQTAPQFGGSTSKPKEGAPSPQVPVSPLSSYFDSAVKKAAAEAVQPVPRTAPQKPAQTPQPSLSAESPLKAERPQTPTPPKNLFEQKLSGAFRVPQVAPSKPTPPPAPPAPQKPLVPQKPMAQPAQPPMVAPRVPNAEVAPPTPPPPAQISKGNLGLPASSLTASNAQAGAQAGGQAQPQMPTPPVPQKPKNDPYREKI